MHLGQHLACLSVSIDGFDECVRAEWIFSGGNMLFGGFLAGGTSFIDLDTPVAMPSWKTIYNPFIVEKIFSSSLLPLS
jgi:hypothetical protein